MTAALPLALHVGRVAHVRHSAPRTRFAYRMWMISVDLDALGTLTSRLFRHNRAALVSLQDRDHGPRDGTPLRPWVEARLQAAGLGAYAASIRFMVLPRVLGYAFNPIAFFFCHDAEGRLGAILHQVKNTFGDQTSYLLPVTPDGAARGTVTKRMHVSPLFDMAGGYRFAVSAPDFADTCGKFAIAIHYGAASAPRLTATMRLTQRPFSAAALARLLLAMPLLPITVMAAIHWEALKLWVRGARFHATPPHLPAGDLGGVA
jgi:DUF1365 family protein